jgi:hypothetical protein
LPLYNCTGASFVGSSSTVIQGQRAPWAALGMSPGRSRRRPFCEVFFGRSDGTSYSCFGQLERAGAVPRAASFDCLSDGPATVPRRPPCDGPPVRRSLCRRACPMQHRRWLRRQSLYSDGLSRRPQTTPQSRHWGEGDVAVSPDAPETNLCELDHVDQWCNRRRAKLNLATSRSGAVECIRWSKA